MTLEELERIYTREHAPLLSDRRKVVIRRAFRLLRRHLGDDFRVSDLSDHQARTYEAARRDGTLAATTGNNGGGAVGTSSIRAELGVLKTVCKWATSFKKNGQPLLNQNPVRNVSLPSAARENIARPVATRERLEAMVEVADQIDPTGGFRTMLNVAWYTGRRVGSIAALRASDVLLTHDQVEATLAAAGKVEKEAESWPAAIRWRAEADKQGIEWIIPIPGVLVNVLRDYITGRSIIGEALLFPARQDRTKRVSKETLYYRWQRAEELAELRHQKQGGWHSFRRAWATARKHLPLKDVMRAGGWSDEGALLRAYQHEDGDTIVRVMGVE